MNNEHILSEIVRIMKESIGIIDQKFQIEVDANFFELGGDSIDASSFMIKINEFLNSVCRTLKYLIIQLLRA